MDQLFLSLAQLAARLYSRYKGKLGVCPVFVLLIGIAVVCVLSVLTIVREHGQCAKIRT